MTRRLSSIMAAVVCAAGLIPAALHPAPASAQGAQPSIVINQLDASAYPTLRAVVTVLDPRGVPEPGLVPAQFQAFDGNTQLEIAEAVAATDEEVSANVVLVMDVSGSMQGPPMEAAKAAAIEFVEALDPGDRAALIAFNGQVTPVVGLTDDRDALTAAIDGLVAQGDTALFEAVQVGAFIASAAATGGNRAAVVLLSDGENDTATSQATSETSLAAASGSGVPVYSIAFGDLTDRAYLQSLSTTTSGAFREATAGSIGEVYSELSLLLRSQYLLAINAAAPADGSDGTVQIVASVDGVQATASGPFVRGVAGAPPAQPPPDESSSSASDSGSGSSTNVALYGAVLLGILAIAGGTAIAGRRFVRNRQELAHQLAVVAPNQELAAAQGVPRRVGVMAPVSDIPVAPSAETGTGRLVEHGGQSRVIEIGAGPLVIGTSPKRCQLVLTDHGAIAPEHARIWLRGNSYVLHHVGGMSRKTLVGGHEADWIVLDSGDEITIGGWRFTFEDEG